jgi:ferredoxin-NADP reductase
MPPATAGALNDDSASALARLLFFVFVHITDAEKDMTPYDVQRFNRLLENPQWTTGVELRRGLEGVRADYANFWSAYDNNSPVIDLKAISTQLDTVLQVLQPDQVDAFRFSLREFIQKVGRPITQPLTPLWLGKGSVTKQKAREEIDALLTATVALRQPPTISAAPVAATPAGPMLAPAASLWPAAAMGLPAELSWKVGRIALRCVGVAMETPDVKTFSFVAVNPTLFTFQPGQFMTLELPIDGQLVRRSYSISSSPARPYALSITVKQVPGGVVSNWLHANMAKDQEICVNGPHGRFTCLEHPADKLLFIAGGSGITPLMSMLRWITDTRSSADIVFIDNVRSAGDVIYERELFDIASRFPDAIRLAIIPGIQVPGLPWNGITGPMSAALLNLFAPDFLERETFVCGPPGYMTMLRTLMQGMGMDMRRFHEESFGGVAPTPAALADAAAAARSLPRPAPEPRRTTPVPTAPAPVMARPGMPAWAEPPRHVPPAVANENITCALTLERSRRTIECRTGDLILEVAERSGVSLMNACRAGVCGTCRVRRLDGTVRMEGQQALSQENIDDGYVLTCVGRIEGRVTIDA